MAKERKKERLKRKQAWRAFMDAWRDSDMPLLEFARAVDNGDEEAIALCMASATEMGWDIDDFAAFLELLLFVIQAILDAIDKFRGE